MASATPSASASRHSASALEASSMWGLRRDAEAHDLPSRFSHRRSDKRIHYLGHFYIGGIAYWEWALPPNVRRGVLPGWGVNMLFILPNSVQREGVPGEAARCTGEAFTTLLTQQRD